MNCPKCGATLENDSKFCISCGMNLETSTEAENIPNVSSVDNTEKNVSPTIKTSNNGINKSGLVVGSILIIIGLVRISNAGTSISSTSFGADFYTYTYKGIVAISEILTSIEITLGWVVVAIGAAINVISLSRLYRS